MPKDRSDPWLKFQRNLSALNIAAEAQAERTGRYIVYHVLLGAAFCLPLIHAEVFECAPGEDHDHLE